MAQAAAVFRAPWAGGYRRLPPFVRETLRWIGWLAVALGLYTLLLLAYGRDPVQAYSDILSSTLGSTYGISEVLVKMIPIVLCALAVAIPARVGLVNVGAEGQLFVGALGATWATLAFPSLPGWILLPLSAASGFVAAGAWAGVCGLLRARGWLNEVFSTMLLNYLAVLVVDYLIFGPWRDPTSSNYPQSRLFPAAGWLPTLAGTRVTVFLFVAVACVAAFALVIAYTRWGLEIRAIGGNPEAARRNGVSITRYLVILMIIGGGLAGLAGMGEVAGLHHRLNPGVSSYYGYTGFLVSWLAGHRAALIPVMAFVMAVLASGGDILQITQGLPYAAVTLLMALILFVVLAARARKGAKSQ
ncbi:MAG TPA: ABC transporter permease [Candidatus Dormibacteraeota bacterium]|nr:ABC transporter permease [Candidatus Dormibacteraeota bacterium]